jgi:hypothetical protein
MSYSGGMTQEIPTPWSTQWPTDDGPFEVTIELSLLPYGDTRRIDASRVSVRSDTTPVTTKVLHDVSVWSLVQRAIKEKIKPEWDAMQMDVPPREYVVSDPASPGGHRLATPEERPGRDASRADGVAAHKKMLRIDEPAKVPSGSMGRPRKITDEVLREVGRIYARLESDHSPEPRKHVIYQMQHLHPGWEIAPRTASRWIKAARDAGYTTSHENGSDKS